MDKLTAKQAAFVVAYISNGNKSTQAALAAGYQPRAAHVTACHLLKHPKIQRAIQARTGQAMARLERKRDYSVDRTLEALHDLAFFDPSDLFLADGSLKPLTDIAPEARRVIAGLEVTETIKGKAVVGRIKKIKLADRRGALDMLMRFHSLYRDKVEVSGGVTILRSSIPRPERPGKAE